MLTKASTVIYKGLVPDGMCQNKATEYGMQTNLSEFQGLFK